MLGEGGAKSNLSENSQATPAQTTNANRPLNKSLIQTSFTRSPQTPRQYPSLAHHFIMVTGITTLVPSRDPYVDTYRHSWTPAGRRECDPQRSAAGALSKGCSVQSCVEACEASEVNFSCGQISLHGPPPEQPRLMLPQPVGRPPGPLPWLLGAVIPAPPVTPTRFSSPSKIIQLSVLTFS